MLLYLGPQLKDKKNETPSKEFLDFDKEIGKVGLFESVLIERFFWKKNFFTKEGSRLGNQRL